jgi:hypothetical protein
MMERKFILENTTPETSTFPTEFQNTRFIGNLSGATYGNQRFVLSQNEMIPGTCPTCAAIAGSEIVSTSQINIAGRGNLTQRLLCFGVSATNNGASNMCEFLGTSNCFSRKEDAPEETERNGLPVITLTRDYQMTGGVVRPAGNTRTKTGITFGRLTTEERVFYTIEPQWVGNQNWISCVPEGTYHLKWNTRTGSDWRDMSFDLWTEDGTSRVLRDNRTNIVIHHGNWVSNTEGCIILGNRLSRYTGETELKGNFWLPSPTVGIPAILRGIIGDEAYLKITSGRVNAIKDTIL